MAAHYVLPLREGSLPGLVATFLVGCPDATAKAYLGDLGTWARVVCRPRRTPLRRPATIARRLTCLSKFGAVPQPVPPTSDK